MHPGCSLSPQDSLSRGESTSDIARSMSLSRRTVQTYISHILAKLGVKGRVDIVRYALKHGWLRDA